MTDSVIRIAQLSDTHFLEDHAHPEGGFAYDTAGAFSAVCADIASRGLRDLVVVTGDIADHGRSAQSLENSEVERGYVRSNHLLLSSSAICGQMSSKRGAPATLSAPMPVMASL